jgi:hypothetical protein
MFGYRCHAGPSGLTDNHAGLLNCRNTRGEDVSEGRHGTSAHGWGIDDAELPLLIVNLGALPSSERTGRTVWHGHQWPSPLHRIRQGSTS